MNYILPTKIPYYSFDAIAITAMDILMYDANFTCRHRWAVLANSLRLAAKDCCVAVVSNARVKTVASTHNARYRKAMKDKFAEIAGVYPDRVGELAALMYDFAARRALTSRRM